MNPKKEPVPSRWTLIRGARQVLTLQGDAGPRRGPAMNNLEVISNAAILLRNDVVECVGSCSRIENLANARNAQEIDATGKIAMPAFIESDASILYDAAVPDEDCGLYPDIAQGIRTASKNKLACAGIANLSDYARYGVMTAGVPSLYADDLKNLVKVLGIQQGLQNRLLRLRPIASFCTLADRPEMADEIVGTWLRVLKERKLASIVEVHSVSAGDGLAARASRGIALSAAAAGFALRVRSGDGMPTDLMAGGESASVISVIGRPRTEMLRATGLLRSNAVFTVGVQRPNDEAGLASVRDLLDRDAAVAISMGAPTEVNATRNMQHAIYKACRDWKMTVEEAISAATFNAACALRASHLTGSIEPGKSADIVILDVPDYRELARRPGISSVEFAMRAGQVVYRRQPLSIDLMPGD